MEREKNSGQSLPAEEIASTGQSEARLTGRQVEAREARGWLDGIEHAANHLTEVHEEILSAYHDGQEIAADEWQVMATLNGVASYVDQMRTALTVMGNGGLRETGNGRWFATDGATDTGSYDTLAEALASIRERFEESGETFMVYEQGPDPAGPEAAGP